MDWISKSSNLFKSIFVRRSDGSAMKTPQSTLEESASDELLLWCASIRDICTPTSILANDAEWKFYLDELIATDRDKVLSFIFEDDQRRSFVSIMIQRAMIRRRLSVFDNEKYIIERTAEVRLQTIASSS